MFVNQWLELESTKSALGHWTDARILYGDYRARGGIENRRGWADLLVGEGCVRRKSNGRVLYMRADTRADTDVDRVPSTLVIIDADTGKILSELGNGDVAHGLRLASALIRSGLLAHILGEGNPAGM